MEVAVQSHALAALILGESPTEPIEQKAGWASEVVGRLASGGNRTSYRAARCVIPIPTMLFGLLKEREDSI